MFGFGDDVEKAGKGVGSVVEAIDGLFTSDEERIDKQTIMMRVAQEPQLLQGKITMKEAGHRSLWVAGWRPGIGWVAAASLGFYFIPQYAAGAYMFIETYINTGEIIDYPVDPKAVMELVLALLGLGSLRTLEKIKGVSK